MATTLYIRRIGDQEIEQRAQWSAQAWADHCALYSMSCVKSSLSTGYLFVPLRHLGPSGNLINKQICQQWHYSKSPITQSWCHFNHSFLYNVSSLTNRVCRRPASARATCTRPRTRSATANSPATSRHEWHFIHWEKGGERTPTIWYLIQIDVLLGLSKCS